MLHLHQKRRTFVRPPEWQKKLEDSGFSMHCGREEERRLTAFITKVLDKCEAELLKLHLKGIKARPRPPTHNKRGELCQTAEMAEKAGGQRLLDALRAGRGGGG